MEQIGSAGGAAAAYAAELENRPLSLLRRAEDTPLHQQQEPARPAMLFALPPAAPRSEGLTEPSQTATEQADGSKPGATGAPGKADAHAVADRVYELMKQEVLLGRLRGAVPERR